MPVPRRPRLRVEQCLDIDADELRREGVLEAGRTSTINSFWDDELALVVEVDARPRDVLLRPGRYGTPTPVNHQTIGLEWVGCHYGGRRALFVCSGEGCERRSLKLYLVEGLFLCRGCHGLVYVSQTKDRFGRLLWQANKLKKELGGEAGTSQLIANRPRGMWKRTYNRKRNAIRDLESSAWRSLAESRGYQNRVND